VGGAQGEGQESEEARGGGEPRGEGQEERRSQGWGGAQGRGRESEEARGGGEPRGEGQEGTGEERATPAQCWQPGGTPWGGARCRGSLRRPRSRGRAPLACSPLGGGQEAPLCQGEEEAEEGEAGAAAAEVEGGRPQEPRGARAQPHKDPDQPAPDSHPGWSRARSTTRPPGREDLKRPLPCRVSPGPPGIPSPGPSRAPARLRPAPVAVKPLVQILAEEAEPRRAGAARGRGPGPARGGPALGGVRPGAAGLRGAGLRGCRDGAGAGRAGQVLEEDPVRGGGRGGSCRG